MLKDVLKEKWQEDTKNPLSNIDFYSQKYYIIYTLVIKQLNIEMVKFAEIVSKTLNYHGGVKVSTWVWNLGLRVVLLWVT